MTRNDYTIREAFKIEIFQILEGKVSNNIQRLNSSGQCQVLYFIDQGSLLLSKTQKGFFF